MRRRIYACLALALCLALLLPAGLADAPPQYLTILFTHDTHDHFYPDAGDRGGYTRLATLLKEQRETPVQASNGNSFQAPTVTLDAGDFSMGSLFQTIYATAAPELRALGAMGYDAVTLGNHEFDYRPPGLADMLPAAKAAGGPLPAVVQANYRTAADAAGEAAVRAMDSFPVTDYTLIERGGLSIAVFGVMGVDSHQCAPMSGMALEPVADAAKRVVAEIREKASPDVVICLSHSGTEGGKGEDYELAKAVDGIDVIISGHTHTTLEQPIRVNDTLIVSCGPYTQNLGRLTIDASAGEVIEYRLIPIDGSIPEDGDMVALAEGFQRDVEQSYLSQYSLGYGETLATAEQELTTQQTGDLIGHAYIDAVQRLEGDDYVPIAFAVAPDGVIRDTVRKGPVTTADAFDILSLGSGADGSPGYPLVSVYLTGRDLKNAFEVDASVSSLMPAATLYGAGCRWEYNPHRMFLDRVTDCRLDDGAAGQEIENDRLYRVVADLYSGQMLSTVKAKSFGLLSITPRDALGNEITNFEDCIIRDKDGGEIKAWYALAASLKAWGTAPVFPGKTLDHSLSPVRLLFPMGPPTAIALAALILAAALLALLISVFVRKLRRAKTRQGYRPYRG